MRQKLYLTSVVAAAIGAAWLFVQILRFSVIDFARVSNESMLPHLKPGQIVVVKKFSPCFRLPFSDIRFFCSRCENGRAYIFANPARQKQRLVKFAVPEPPALKRAGPGQASCPGATGAACTAGDIIWFTQGAPIAAESPARGLTCYFEGSNRENSVDSRHFGAIPVEKIEGKVVYPGIFLTP